jgi:Cu(I)/Ag(I) efflux system membrane fusion protein
LILVFCACSNQNEQKLNENEQKMPAIVIGNNSDAFNTSFRIVLNNYFNLQDQLVAEKDSGIAQSARALIMASDSLKVDELKADSNLINTARTYSDGISAELKGLLGETELISKRRSFQMVSDQLYDLIRTVQYNQQVLYHMYCDKAFDDQGAYWISDKTEIKNPYLSQKATQCGEIKDTIKFQLRQ